MFSAYIEHEILLVEDDPVDAELAARALGQLGLGRLLYRVRDGQEALDFVLARGVYVQRNASTTPQFILLDLNLPKVSGLEVLLRLKRSVATRDIPVIVMTGSRAEADKAASFECGANGFIRKPLDLDQLESAICDIGYYWMAFGLASA